MKKHLFFHASRCSIILATFYAAASPALAQIVSGAARQPLAPQDRPAAPAEPTGFPAATAAEQKDPAAPAPTDQTVPGATGGAPQGNATASTGSEAQGIGDIIVTATRRETTLQRTPQAISVLTGQAQFLKGQTRLEDLTVSVPNVNFASTSNTSQLYIRGIGNTFINAGGDPGVALYQDGAYISDQSTTNVNFFDVQRVEVLRGPQGALYGRNATGGAITITSAKPTSEFHASISGTLGNYARRETEGFISGPLGVADTDARLSYQVKHRDGYTRNLIGDRPGAPDRLDDLDSQAIRVQTLTHLPGSGTLGLLFSYFREKDAGAALAVKPTPGVQYPVELLYGAVPPSGAFVTEANVGRNRIDVYTANVDYEQPIGSTTLSVVGNYRRSTSSFLNDCDGTRIDNCRYNRDNAANDYYLDAHLASAGDSRFRWLVGATYLNFKITSLNDVIFPFPLSYLAPGAPSNVAFPFEVIAGGTVKTKSYAAYTDLSFKLTDVWSIMGQARYSYTRKRASETQIIAAFSLNNVNVPNTLKNDFVPFKVGVQGQLTSDTLVYANYSTATKDGAINLGANQTETVRPERVKSVEAGFKTTLFDRMLRINGAVFHSIYTDLQISQLLGTVVTLVNAPRAEINGAELEVLATPTPGLQLRANAGYLDPKLKAFSNGRNQPGLVGGPSLDLAGNQLPYDAKFSLNLGADYKFAPVSGFTATIGGEYSYHSRIYFNEFNDRLISQSPVGLFNATASFGPEGDRWKVFGYLNNIGDKTVQNGVTIYSGLLGAARAISYNPPRTFGAGVSLSF